MRTRALGATFFVLAAVLGGCAGSNGVGQAKPNTPVVVVGTNETAKKAPDKPKLAALLEAKQGEMVGIFGVLGDQKDGKLPYGTFGSGGLNDDIQGAFGGLGVSGVVTGGGGGVAGGIGLGSIGTIGRVGGTGSGYGSGSSSSAEAPVKPKFGQLTVTGPLTVDIVQRYIDDHVDDVQTCQRLEQERTGSRYGSFKLMLTIDTTGHVSDVRLIESSAYSRDLDNCVAHVAGSFEFPAPRTGDVSVTIPISF